MIMENATIYKCDACGKIYLRNEDIIVYKKGNIDYQNLDNIMFHDYFYDVTSKEYHFCDLQCLLTNLDSTIRVLEEKGKIKINK